MTDMPWIKWLDLDTAITEAGEVAVTLARAKPEHLNHNDAVNGAVAFGVAEVAGIGAAVLSFLDLLPSSYVAVESATIAYVAPAIQALVATGRIEPAAAALAREMVASGKPASIGVSVVLTDLAGRATGSATFTVAVRRRRHTGRRSSEQGRDEAAR
jgi:acyl-coenzyme A thioesterase PaaI-like protein